MSGCLVFCFRVREGGGENLGFGVAGVLVQRALCLEGYGSRAWL